MTVKKYLAGIKPEQYHIFDSHQEGMADRGVDHKDEDYKKYSYNIHKNQKPKPGDVFLYRRPGKSTANRKFNIYGGGVIDKISDPDRDGNVKADIKMAFKLETPIEQGDDRIESFVWTSKEKTLMPGSAAEYLGDAGDEADGYYVYKMARTKMDEYTAVIPYSTGNGQGKFYGVDNGSTVFVLFRIYLDETGRGADYYELINDRAIVFHKKQ